MSDAMLDSLSLQLREAESRRAEAERAHQVSRFRPANFSFIHSRSPGQFVLFLFFVFLFSAGTLETKGEFDFPSIQSHLYEYHPYSHMIKAY